MSDSQVLGDLPNQIPLDKYIDSIYIDEAYDTKQCCQVIAEWQAHAVVPLKKMRSFGKIKKFIFGSEINYLGQLNI